MKTRFLTDRAGELGVKELILGMAHRGRLNVLRHYKMLPGEAKYDPNRTKGSQEALLAPARSILPLSTVLSGEYGIHDVALSLPCVVSAAGVEQVLTPERLARLYAQHEHELHGAPPRPFDDAPTPAATPPASTTTGHSTALLEPTFSSHSLLTLER